MIDEESLLTVYYKLTELKRRIDEYVEQGGRDAFAFSLAYSPDYDDIPGRDIQRMIDEEVVKLKRKGER